MLDFARLDGFVARLRGLLRFSIAAILLVIRLHDQFGEPPTGSWVFVAHVLAVHAKFFRERN